MTEPMIAEADGLASDSTSFVYEYTRGKDAPWLDYDLHVVFHEKYPPFISERSSDSDSATHHSMCIHINDCVEKVWRTLFCDANAGWEQATGAANVCMGVMLAAAGYERKDGQAC